MTICLEKSCLFGLLNVRVFLKRLSICMCSFPFEFEGGTWALIVLIPDQ